MKPPTQSLSLHLSLSFSLRPHTGSHHLHTHVHAHTSPHPIPTLVPGVASAPLHSLAKSRSGAQERSFSTSNRNGAAADGQNGEQGANDSTSGCRCGQNKATEPDEDCTEVRVYPSLQSTSVGLTEPTASRPPFITERTLLLAILHDGSFRIFVPLDSAGRTTLSVDYHWREVPGIRRTAAGSS